MRRRLLVPALALAAALALAGCAPQPDLAAGPAGRLQQQVLAVSTASAAGKLDEARAGLDAAEKELGAALNKGEISKEKFQSVLDAIRLVRADLEAAIADAAAKEQAARNAQAAKDQAARDAALAQQLADLKAQADAAARAQGTGAGAPSTGSGKSTGKGKSNGNGNGNGNGD